MWWKSRATRNYDVKRRRETQRKKKDTVQHEDTNVGEI